MQYDFNLLAGQSQNIDVKGRFFKYKSGIGMIRVRTSQGGAVDLLPGQGVENVDFTGLTVSDRSGAANVGSILAGDFDFRDDRISGTVDVVDGGFNRTIAGQAFNGALFQSGVAGQYSHGMLFNPVDSGRRVIVSSYDLASNAASTALIGVHNASFGGGIAGPSKLSGGAASKALLQVLAQAAQLPPLANAKILYLAANAPFLGTLKEPIVLLPGFGLLICVNSAQNLPLTANFEYTEVVI